MIYNFKYNTWHTEMSDIQKKIRWIPTARRLTLAARVEVQPRGFETGISEGDMDPVQAWCKANNCGVRISFDTFRFRNQREITLFLLRWS